MEKRLQENEAEREEALAREKLMSVKYKELDIFKLDIIARELKGIDQELGMVGKQVRVIDQDASKLRNFDEQQQMKNNVQTPLDGLHAMRAHIRDVITKCLSETQKMHIGTP